MTSPFPQITSAPQAQAEIIVNEALETLEHAAVYGKAHATTSGLVWGYYGGRWGGFAVAAGTVTLATSTTTYLVVAIATGVLSASTATTNWNDATNYARAYKITTGPAAVTAEEDHRAGPRGAHGQGASASINAVQCIAIACSDETTALTAGTAKATFINPFDTAFVIAKVKASLTTAQASGSIFTVDVNEAGVSILSTKLTIDNTEKNTSTAATAAVLSDTSIAANAECSVDIDQIGDGTAKGLKIYILGWPV